MGPRMLTQAASLRSRSVVASFSASSRFASVVIAMWTEGFFIGISPARSVGVGWWGNDSGEESSIENQGLAGHE